MTPKKSSPNPKKRMAKIKETTLEIDLRALEHNFKYLKSKILSSTKFMGVVKAFAYGSDSVIVAKKLEALGVDYLAVAYTSEGITLRDAGIKTPVLVLHPMTVNFKTIIKYCLEPNIYSFQTLKDFVTKASQEKQIDYPIHLKFNTGLNRLGFGEKDVAKICGILSKTNAVKVKSVFSHLAASEDLDEKPFTLNQIQRYNTLVSALEIKLGYAFTKHIGNTSGILNYPEAHFDMVRSGIGLYGFGNSEKENKHFKPIASLKSIISQIHHLSKGESLGYNRAFVAQKSMKTATVPIGHADGIGRQYGNGHGYVIINNKHAPIIGNICMDMIMVDVSEIRCSEGDDVILFDKNHTAENFAKAANTISYEIITAISQRVKRVVVE